MEADYNETDGVEFDLKSRFFITKTGLFQSRLQANCYAETLNK